MNLYFAKYYVNDSDFSVYSMVFAAIAQGELFIEVPY